MTQREIRVRADWREEPDWELLARALLALARQLDSESNDGDTPEPDS